jgi:hypothetical protein
MCPACVDIGLASLMVRSLVLYAPPPSHHSLSFSSAGNRAMTALSDSLIDSRSLRTLDLSNCNMDSEGAKAVGVGLQVMICVCLCVCDCGWDIEHLKGLLSSLICM